jgi:hypothetical protein
MGTSMHVVLWEGGYEGRKAICLARGDKVEIGLVRLVDYVYVSCIDGNERGRSQASSEGFTTEIVLTLYRIGFSFGCNTFALWNSRSARRSWLLSFAEPVSERLDVKGLRD